MRKIKGIALIVLVGLLIISCSPGTGAGSTPVIPETSGGTTPAAGEAAATPAVNTTQPAGATNGTSPVTSKELNLYGWSEYIPQALLDGFTKEYGVTVHYDTYSSNEELMAKLQAGASGYDVIIPSDYTIVIMTKQGLLEPLDASQIPNLSNVDEKFRSLPFDPGNKYTVPYQWGTVGMVVNTEKVTKPVTSWNELWNPAYKGRVVMLDDEREVIGVASRVLGYDVNTKDPAELDQAKAKLKELMPNVKLFDSDNPKAAMLSGETWLGQTWNGEAALAHRENPKIDYVCPKESCVVWFDNLAIPKGAPHKDAAQAFLNYVLRPDVSLLITKEFPYSNPNKAALELMKTQDPAMYQDYMGFRATNPTEEDLKNAKMIEDVGEATSLYDQIWTEVKGN